MKKTIALISFLLLVASLQVSAQKVYTDPPIYTNPAETLKIFVDLTQMDCDKLVGDAGPLYMWSWMPAEPLVGNGMWGASNPDLEMANEGPNLWSITIVPTDFYGVSAQDVYDNDIFFLVKGVDGGSGGDCSAAGLENKTEDLTLIIDPPGAVIQKVYSFPAPASEDSILISDRDVFTLLYDNAQEDKIAMQNPGDLFVYARAYDMNGNEYKPSPISQVGSNPALKMTKNGDLYNWSIVPRVLFGIPDGETLDLVRLQVTKPVVNNSDDAVDGLWEFFVRCQ